MGTTSPSGQLLAPEMETDHSPRFDTRQVAAANVDRLIAAGLHPVLARVAAARGIERAEALHPLLEDLPHPRHMAGLDRAAEIVIETIERHEPIVVVGDYDCDGATATAVVVLGLRRLGAHVDYLVPNRVTHGYGLSPALAALATEHPRLGRPRLLITVDNGISSLAGVAAARDAGMRVIITDHHLPGDTLPAADAIVDPNVSGCRFPSRNLAGVGVGFYLVAAVRAALVARQRLSTPAPTLADLLDLVAVGTVADVVPLDENNRRLVNAGLQRLRSGRARPGLQALMRVAGCAQERIGVREIGFMLGPRINAAGRLEDITIGIECLLAATQEEAAPLAEQLDEINRRRRDTQLAAQAQALTLSDDVPAGARSVVVHDPGWHQGIVGLVAARLRERHHKPAFAFARDDASGSWRGSGRSIPGVHLRDVLALIDSRAPGLIERFGGHAMAAGLSLREEALAEFPGRLEDALQSTCDPDVFTARVLTDGGLNGEQCTLDLALLLERQIWGAGFPPPLFANRFRVREQRIVGSGHLQLGLELDGRRLPAIFFGRDAPLPENCQLAYRLQTNEYRGTLKLQLAIEAVGESG